ncbi:unnamed protein product, partial [Polarella glacialis]
HGPGPPVLGSGIRDQDLGAASPRGEVMTESRSSASSNVYTSGGYAGFRPCHHSMDVPSSSHPMGALLNISTSYEEEAKRLATTKVHVSGLPADCEDDAVEAKLRQVLQDCVRRAAAAEAEFAASANQVADSVADVEVLPEEADSATKAEAEAEVEAEADADMITESPDDDAEVFVSCAVVRNKDTLVCKGYCFLAFTSLVQAEEAVEFLNGGVEVAGVQVSAQLSFPKAAKTKQEKVVPQEEELHDLRLRRKRYQGTGKHAQYGHEAASSGTVEGGGNTKTRNSIGRLQGIAGTRDGRPVLLDDSKCSSRSGFRA